MLESQKRILKSLKPPLNQNLSSARPLSTYFIKTNLNTEIIKETFLHWPEQDRYEGPVVPSGVKHRFQTSLKSADVRREVDVLHLLIGGKEGSEKPEDDSCCREREDQSWNNRTTDLLIWLRAPDNPHPSTPSSGLFVGWTQSRGSSSCGACRRGRSLEWRAANKAESGQSTFLRLCSEVLELM